MKTSLLSPNKDPMGAAIADYFAKGRAAKLRVFSSQFDEDEIPEDPLAREVIRYMNRDNIKTIPWNFTVFPSQTFKENFGASLLSYAQENKTFDQVKSDMIADWKKESK